ncbi:MAG: hypothetical protein IJ808_05795, partial [Muribaculaceae bacterium]|nr:hypothetical protein [Muribaculaceae bacterium]
DYDGTGGESHHPGSWDIMAGGGSYNYSRTPCGYTIFERFSLGWANPSVITQNGSYTLGAVNQTNEGYIIKSPSNAEYFIFENRQKTGWDYYLPGHGMTICRVDSSNLDVWYGNSVNNNPKRMYYEMLRAGNATSGDNPSDPFPGTAKVRLIDSQSTPNLNTWSQLPNEFMIHSIAENGGVITFDVIKESEVETLVEDFETMPVTTSTRETNVPGRFATWTFSKSNVMSPTEEDSKNGQNAVGIVSGGVLTMTSDFNYEPYLVTVRAFNPTTTEAKYKLLYSTNQGSTWTALDDVISVQANTLSRLAWSVNIDKPVRFRISMTGGSTSKKSYLDDVTIYHRDAFQSYKQGDVNGDGEVDVNDVNILINIVLGKDDASQYGGRANVDGAGDVDVTDVNTLINLVLGK